MGSNHALRTALIFKLISFYPYYKAQTGSNISFYIQLNRRALLPPAQSLPCHYLPCWLGVGCLGCRQDLPKGDALGTWCYGRERGILLLPAPSWGCIPLGTRQWERSQHLNPGLKLGGRYLVRAWPVRVAAAPTALWGCQTCPVWGACLPLQNCTTKKVSLKCSTLTETR